jgi:FAD/FMN-containing dehydrogenase
VSTTTVVPRMSGFTGELLMPGHPAYDRTRRPWNRAIDRRPAFIACCRSTTDVSAAVRFARRNELPVAVRGGGHSIPGHCVCEGGIMIDLQPMKSIAVDPRRRTADVAPGVLWRELDAAAQRHGLATPGGEISDTGVAGLTLGGGVGWLSRLHGLAGDSLLAVELVTADGEVIEVDDHADPDLMWGLRGGGGNFGIVTRFRFAVHPVGPLWGGMVMFRGDRAAEVLAAAVELGDEAPPELGIEAVIVSAPPAPFIPAEHVGRPVVAVAAAYAGDPRAGRDAVAPLSRLAEPMADTFGVMAYADLQRMADAANPPGWRHYVRSDFLRGLDGEATGRLARHGTSPSSPHDQLLLRRLGGRIGDADLRRKACANRDGEHMLVLAAAWQDPAEDPAPHQAWARGAWEDMRPWAQGTNVNHLGDEGAGRVREAYAPGSWGRLTALKARMDPDNAFALNQNIPPVGWSAVSG